MIVAANSGIADEVELIDRHVRHLQSIGVDRIVVTDTLEEIRPDWILFGDADEFHIPWTDRIRDVLETASTDVLQIERFNVPVSVAGPLWPAELAPRGHDRLQLIVGQIQQFNRPLQANPDTPWILGRILPKDTARADAVRAGIRMGAQVARAQDERTPASTGVLIAQVPNSSRQRFLRKMDKVREVFARAGDQCGEGEAWHWRRRVTPADEGRDEGEHKRQLFDGAKLAELRASGVVMSAAERFAAPVMSPTLR